MCPGPLPQDFPCGGGWEGGKRPVLGYVIPESHAVLEVLEVLEFWEFLGTLEFLEVLEVLEVPRK